MLQPICPITKRMHQCELKSKALSCSHCYGSALCWTRWQFQCAESLLNFGMSSIRLLTKWCHKKPCIPSEHSVFMPYNFWVTPSEFSFTLGLISLSSLLWAALLYCVDFTVFIWTICLLIYFAICWIFYLFS